MKAQVLLPKIFNYTFTYESKQNSIQVGDFVEVPFGKNKEVGVVWPGKTPDVRNIKIKSIIKRVDNFSLDLNLINYINWFATYNMMPLGLVLKMTTGKDLSFILKNDKDFESIWRPKSKFQLNKEQKKALEFLEFKNDKFNVSVLQGTTGSGKTLVYFERIKKIIEKNKQALVLLPEIFLTNEFRSRFTDYFGFEPAIWHSKDHSKKQKSNLERYFK